MKIQFHKLSRLKALPAMLCLLASVNAAADSPVANSGAVVTSGNARFTVLTPQMIRIEYSDKCAFEDRATFAIQNRQLDVPSFATNDDGEYLYITTEKVTLKYRKGTNPKTLPASGDNLTITISHNGHNEVWYPGKPDPLNLKGTSRTLDGADGDNLRSELENGLISRSGWAVIDDSWTAARPDGSRSFALAKNDALGYDWWLERQDPQALDLYFLGYGSDYKTALYDFTRVAGKIPLPPSYVFGYWYSRYASYSADDYRSIMNDLKTNNIPTDVMILDMAWHWDGKSESQSSGIGGWTGWSWNTNLIPNPKGLLTDIHNNGLKVSLNLHPADGINSHESPTYYNLMKDDLNGKYDSNGNIGWNLDYADFTRSFFNRIIRDHEATGVDFWWLDWQQYLVSYNTPGLGETFWCNHVFFNDMKVNRPDRRPVIFHRWGGLGSHRYQIGFSGDASINFPTLAYEPYFTATASNVGYTYWGHDLGGHMFTSEDIVNDPELILRWLQFGVFTPIFRSHATMDDRIERRIWKLPNFASLLKTVQLRYALFPYIYTMARKTYDTGLGICRPLYYESPDDDEAYLYEGEYYFGDDIIVAPITEPAANGVTATKTVWLPEGKWWSVATKQIIEGPCTKTMRFGAEDIPYFYRAGAMIPNNPAGVNHVTEHPAEMVLNIVAGDDGAASLYEDQGDNANYATEYATTELTHTVTGLTETYTIGARQGTATGLADSRAWTLNIYNATAPTAVTINGTPADGSQWTYSDKVLTIKVPSTACANTIAVSVTYTERAGIDDAYTADPIVLSYDEAAATLTANLVSQRKNVTLSVLNAAGVECLHKEYAAVSDLRESLAHLAPAIYICRVIADTETSICKIRK